MKVSNMTSSNGNKVANQFIITDRNTGIETFQSYDTVIARRGHGMAIELDASAWDYSRTTSKYRNQFLGMTTAEVKKGIADGSIQLVNLN